MHDGRALSVRRTVGFSTFGGNIFRGLHIEEAKMFFGQFVCDVASVTCVVGLQCPLMRGRAIHEWTLFTAAPIDAVGRGATIRMVGLFHVGLCV